MLESMQHDCSAGRLQLGHFTRGLSLHCYLITELHLAQQAPEWLVVFMYCISWCVFWNNTFLNILINVVTIAPTTVLLIINYPRYATLAVYAQYTCSSGETEFLPVWIIKFETDASCYSFHHTERMRQYMFFDLCLFDILQQYTFPTNLQMSNIRSLTGGLKTQTERSTEAYLYLACTSCERNQTAQFIIWTAIWEIFSIEEESNKDTKHLP